MKIHIVGADARHVNPIIQQSLLNHLGPQVRSLAHADVVVVPLVDTVGYTFNPQLGQIAQHRKKWVLLDYVEYGANKVQYHLFGDGTFRQHRDDRHEEWKKLDEFVASHPPVAYFKRELMRDHPNESILPLEFPSTVMRHIPQDKAAFDARPIAVFNVWGYSNDVRPNFHGSAIRHAVGHGYPFCTDIRHLKRECPNGVWVTHHSPHYDRVSISTILEWQAKAKISVSLPGCGVKCIRHGEAASTSIMATTGRVRWSFPWIDMENSVSLSPPSEQMPNDLGAALASDRLYDIYRAGLENHDRYVSDRYANEYIIPKIKERL